MPNAQQSAQPTQPQAPAQQKKSNIILTIIGWIMGVFVIIFGLISFYFGILPGIVLLVLGLFILPPISNRIRSSLKWEKEKFIIAKASVIVILVILYIIAISLSVPTKDLNTNINKSTIKKEEQSNNGYYKNQINQNLNANISNTNLSTETKEETNTNQITNTNQQEEIKLDITQPQWGEIVKAPQVELRGKVQPQDVKVTVNGNQAGVAPDGSFGIMVDLKEVGDVKIEIIARKGGLESKKSAYVIRLLTPVEEKEERETSLKAEAETIPFKELYRNIEQNTGKEIHYRGKVVQVMESTMRVNITKGDYGFYEDTVLVRNLDSDSPKILEDDIIEFWGIVTGEESYTAVFGQTISLPAINAEIIEVIE